MKTDLIDTIDAIVDQGIDIPSGSIFLFGEINDKMALRLQARLMALEFGRPGGIRVVISSPGGSEDAGFAMYDMLRACPCTVTTVGIGSVMSMAALVFQAGDFRQLTPECRLMVHNGTFSGFGKNTQQNHIVDYAQEMEAVNKRYATLIAQRAGLQPSKVAKWCRGDKFFSAQEAMQWGLADAIVSYPLKKRK